MKVLLTIFFAAISISASVVAEPVSKAEMPQLRWKGSPIRIYVSTSLTRANSNFKADSDVLAAVRASLKAWSDAAEVVFIVDTSDKQGVSPAGASGDGISLITVAATPENVLFFAKDGQNTAAKTRTFYNRKGMITEADIVLNPFQQFSTDGSFGTFDLQSVLTHEIGHLLGLRHSSVLGSIMSGNLPKNGVTDVTGFKPAALTDVDTAMARDIYGTADMLDDCCSAISGKLSVVGDRATRRLVVWAEDTVTGRVVGQAEGSSDGSFRMGGIPAGTYRVLARAGSGVSDEIGVIELGPADQKTIDQVVKIEEPKFSLGMLGTGSELTESAVSLAPGSRHTLFVAGNDVDSGNVSFGVNSPFLHINRASIAREGAVQAGSLLRFDIAVDTEAPTGVYSLFAYTGAHSTSVLIGAVRIR